jgi:sulfotransferase
MALNFITGLPRSGSTLLSAVLRQNPSLHADVESPLVDVVVAATKAMSAAEGAVFISDDQRQMVLKGIIQSYYSHLSHKECVFDSNRRWSSLTFMLARLCPEARLICCVRNPAWILDSLERNVRRNALIAPRIFGHEMGTVYSRAEEVSTRQLLRPSLQALRQAWFSEEAESLVAVRYESFVQRPQEVIDRLYAVLGLQPWPHDFKQVTFERPDFDAILGSPGLHTVVGPVKAVSRPTVLPPELFSSMDDEFWLRPAENPNGVLVL